MSIALDSPMEALAINYLTHGVLTAVNNVWAWIAFLTAAISFWKIKHSINSSPPPPHHSLRFSSQSPPQLQTLAVLAEPDQPEMPSTTTRTSSFTSTKRYTTFCTLENRRSGKFSVYYGQDETAKDDNNDGEEEVSSINRHHEEEEKQISLIRRNREEEDRQIGSIRRNREEEDRQIDSIKHNREEEKRTMSSIRSNREEREGWEAVLKMKTAEMGWYRYQDLTVLDGNVVQLWNEIRTY